MSAREAGTPDVSLKLQEKIPEYKKRLREKKPVVHHITNFVTMYPCARITTFLGASPIMAFACKESAQVAARADALVINTGTLNDEVIRSIPMAMAVANDRHIPAVLDPVGARLSDYRYDFIRSLLERFHFDVIRCNGAELLNLHGETVPGRGIDGDTGSPRLARAAAEVARARGCVVACTGPVDYISDGTDTIALSRGVPQLPMLSGTGCMVNSLIASYLPVAGNAFEAAALGILTMCTAGEAAAARLSDPLQLGTFEALLMDQIALP